MSPSLAIVVIVAVAIGALLKSTTGMGLPLVAIPAISIVTGLQEAVIITALPNVIINAGLAWRERGHLDETRDLSVLAVAGVAGAVGGSLTLLSFSPRPLLGVLALVVFSYVGLNLVSPGFALSSATTSRWAPAVGTGAGFLQGAIGISGPLVGSWLHACRLTKQAYVLTLATLFCISGLAQLGVLLFSRDLTRLWMVVLLGSIPAIVSLPVGARLRDRFSSAGFDRVVLVLLSVSGVMLLIRAIA
jgi:uncharacterized membrane protein YfcA